MKVAVLGAGAIGAYVGAALARAGANVHLVARGAHLEALCQQGVRVLSPRGDFAAHPPATGDPREVGPCDYVFLGLKATSYPQAGSLVAPLLHEGTAIIAAQNGIPWWYFHGLRGPHQDYRIEAVDPGGATSRALPVERAIGCVVYCSTELSAPGVVRHLEGTRFTLGEPTGERSRRCVEFSDAMVAGGLKAPIDERIRDEVWVKLMGNVAFNPLSALTRATMAQICRHSGTSDLVRAMMRETLEVARAVGANPDVSVDKRFAGAQRVGEHKTSMLQDLENGRPLELAVILGAVIELADLTSVAAPTLRTVHAVTDLLRASVSQEAGGCRGGVPASTGVGEWSGTQRHPARA